MKLLLLMVSVTYTVQASSSSLRLSKRMIDIFRPLTVKQVAVDSREQLAQVIDKFQLEVVFTRKNYQRHLSKANDVSERIDLRSRWQEWAVVTKEELRQLAESRQHLIDEDILSNLNAIDGELRHVHTINLW